MTGTNGNLDRVEGAAKVNGTARYAADYPIAELVYVWPVQSTIASGVINAIDRAAVLKQRGVLDVITWQDAERLHETDDPELAILQTPTVSYRGQFVAAIVAESPEIACEAARTLWIDYRERGSDVTLVEDHPAGYAPDSVDGDNATATQMGGFDEAFNNAPIRIDQRYETPAQHNNPMEPHATIAKWDGERLRLWDSNQGCHAVSQTVANLFGLSPDAVHVTAEHVGGGFGAKGTPRPNVVLAAMASRRVGRPAKVVLTRAHQFSVVGYRTPSIQRIRLGADATGRLCAVGHDVTVQSSTLLEFTEAVAVTTRAMYAGPNRRTSHRIVRLDVPTPRWMRAPGACPGMFALESAMDELAVACGMDPIELRTVNEPERDPETGRPFSSRNLVACLRVGADRFDWATRDPRPAIRRRGSWLVGTGVAASIYGAWAAPAQAAACVDRHGEFRVMIGAADIGTGARTVLTQLAARTLGVAAERVRVDIGDSTLPVAPIAAGSIGTSSWGWAVVKACQVLHSQLARTADGMVPAEGLSVSVDTASDVAARRAESRYSFGAQFAEAWIHAGTGEIRISRLHGVFAVGNIINAKLARSQLIGGMTMGLSMALHEEGRMDARFGDYLNHDLSGYHIATHADIEDIQAVWIDEPGDSVNPMGAKGIGEIGIVGTAAAIGNAVWHATGIRVRRLPIRFSRMLPISTGDRHGDKG